MLNTNHKAKPFNNENDHPYNPFLSSNTHLTNLANITPSLEQGKRIYNNIGNSSPFKIKSFESTTCSGKTITRCGTDEKRNPFNNYTICSPIISQSLQESFNNVDSLKKPALTRSTSKQKLLMYAKTKEYEEDLRYYNESKCSETIYEEDEEIVRMPSKDRRIAELISKLPVPLEKKNDEAFKIQAMKKMKKIAFPDNKSARNSDLKVAHQEKLRDGTFV
jgi:hypothetical protein